MKQEDGKNSGNEVNKQGNRIGSQVNVQGGPVNNGGSAIQHQVNLIYLLVTDLNIAQKLLQTGRCCPECSTSTPQMIADKLKKRLHIDKSWQAQQGAPLLNSGQICPKESDPSPFRFCPKMQAKCGPTLKAK